MFTAADIKKDDESELDRRIKAAVKDRDAGPNSTYMRVYIEDPWCHNIENELEKRGFKNIKVPSITLKGDVYFEW